MIKEFKEVIEIFNYYGSPFVSAVATLVIAIYAWKSHRLSKQIKRSNDLKIRSDEEFREQVSSLYQAIAVATLSSAHNYGQALAMFQQHYKGKVKIFD